MRSSMLVKSAFPSSGGLPRPSLKWHVEQERALKSGPRPSRLVLLDGGSAHCWLKKALPVENISMLS
jgi:hypothetical protein